MIHEHGTVGLAGDLARFHRDRVVSVGEALLDGTHVGHLRNDPRFERVESREVEAWNARTQRRKPRRLINVS